MYQRPDDNFRLNAEFVNVNVIEREARELRNQYLAEAARGAAERLKVSILTVLNRAFANAGDDLRGGALR